MRILVTTTAGTGHILPVVPAAQALHRAGHEVVWATADESCRVVERFGFSTRPCGIDSDVRLRRFRDEYPEVFAMPARERRANGFAALFAEIAAPIMASELRTIVDQVHPDLVMHEVAEMGIVPIATVHSIPRIVVGYSGALPLAVVAAAANAVGPVWDAFSLPVPPDIGLYAHDYLHPFPGVLGQHPHEPGVHEFRPTPPALRDAGANLEWLTDLGIVRPVVYATFGTELGDRAPWAPLLQAIAGLDVDAVVTTGRRVDPTSLLARLDQVARARVQVRDYVAQDAVLSRAAIVVSHGGAGTMIGAGLAGVPQLAIPIGADQFANADAFTAAGAARTLVGSVDPNAIAQRINSILNSDESRAAAIELAEQFAAMPVLDDVLAQVVARPR